MRDIRSFVAFVRFAASTIPKRYKWKKQRTREISACERDKASAPIEDCRGESPRDRQAGVNRHRHKDWCVLVSRR